MPARTSTDQVRLIISTSLDDETIELFIDDVALWIDEEPALAALSDGRKELIERYLASALIRLKDLGLVSVTLGDVREQYQVDPNVSDYLLRASAFDPTGTVRRYFLPPKDRIPVRTWKAKGFASE